jgi:hypothetical protein
MNDNTKAAWENAKIEPKEIGQFAGDMENQDTDKWDDTKERIVPSVDKNGAHDVKKDIKP